MSGIEEPNPSVPTESASPQSLGQRLRARREASGRSVAELAAELKLKTHIIDAIEDDQLDRLGAPVFTRGYLAAYAKAVGLPIVVVEAAAPKPEPTPSPALVTHTGSRHSARIGRYTSRLSNVLLTAAIVVPIIWIATSSQLPSERAMLTALDAADGVGSEALPGARAVRSDGPDYPVMASLTPVFQTRPSASPSAPLIGVEALVAEVAEPMSEPSPLLSGGLQLKLVEDSWVEVTSSDGRVLESTLLRAGSERQYPLGEGLRVSLGNAGGVELRLNGESVDVSAFRRANVARFRLAGDGALSPASAG
jgi:cytoskeleton protein RodZ